MLFVVPVKSVGAVELDSARAVLVIDLVFLNGGVVVVCYILFGGIAVVYTEGIGIKPAAHFPFCELVVAAAPLHGDFNILLVCCLNCNSAAVGNKCAGVILDVSAYRIIGLSGLGFFCLAVLQAAAEKIIVSASANKTNFVNTFMMFTSKFYYDKCLFEPLYIITLCFKDVYKNNGNLKNR